MSLQDTLGVQGVGLLLFAGLFCFVLFSFSLSLCISFSSFAFSVFWYPLDCNPKSVDFEIFSFCLSSELYKELSNEKVLRVGSSSCSNCARS